MKSKKTTAAEKLNPAKRQDELFALSIARALELQEAIEGYKAELDAIKEEFREYFGEEKSSTTLATPAGTAIYTVSNTYSIDPESIPELKKIYKSEFNSFVKEKTTYSPETALRNKLSDADYKHADAIRKAVIIKTSYAVKFEPIKEASAVKKSRKSA